MIVTVPIGSRMLDALDPYILKRALERVNEIRDLAAASADLGFLRRVRRATLLLPLWTSPASPDTSALGSKA